MLNLMKHTLNTGKVENLLLELLFGGAISF